MGWIHLQMLLSWVYRKATEEQSPSSLCCNCMHMTNTGIFRSSRSHRIGFEYFFVLRYNAVGWRSTDVSVQHVASSSSLHIKRSKETTWNHCLPPASTLVSCSTYYVTVKLVGGDMFYLNVGWPSTDGVISQKIEVIMLCYVRFSRQICQILAFLTPATNIKII